MGKPKIIANSYTQFRVESYEGQSIEDRCKKLVETGEPIKDTSPLIYTPKEKGVMPQYDVRADKCDFPLVCPYVVLWHYSFFLWCKD